jgi:hypothetical protein
MADGLMLEKVTKMTKMTRGRRAVVATSYCRLAVWPFHSRLTTHDLELEANGQ